MPMNMSYCKFENTLAALRECWNDWDDPDALPEIERKAQAQLIRLCKQIADNYAEDSHDAA